MTEDLTPEQRAVEEKWEGLAEIDRRERPAGSGVNPEHRAVRTSVIVRLAFVLLSFVLVVPFGRVLRNSDSGLLFTETVLMIIATPLIILSSASNSTRRTPSERAVMVILALAGAVASLVMLLYMFRHALLSGACCI